MRTPNDATTGSTPTRSRLQLKLHQTSQQDVLLDLGAPERKWVKGEKGMVDGFSMEEGADEVDFGISRESQECSAAEPSSLKSSSLSFTALHQPLRPPSIRTPHWG